MASLLEYQLGDWDASVRTASAGRTAAQPDGRGAARRGPAVGARRARRPHRTRARCRTLLPWARRDGMVAVQLSRGARPATSARGPGGGGARAARHARARSCPSCGRTSTSRPRSGSAPSAIAALTARAGELPSDDRGALLTPRGRPAGHREAAASRLVQPPGAEARGWLARLDAEHARLRWTARHRPAGVRTTWSPPGGPRDGVRLRQRLRAGPLPRAARGRRSARPATPLARSARPTPPARSPAGSVRAPLVDELRGAWPWRRCAARTRRRDAHRPRAGSPRPARRRAAPTGSWPGRCSSARRRSASTSRTSWPSCTPRAAPRRAAIAPSRTGSLSPPLTRARDLVRPARPGTSSGSQWLASSSATKRYGASTYAAVRSAAARAERDVVRAPHIGRRHRDRAEPVGVRSAPSRGTSSVRRSARPV